MQKKVLIMVLLVTAACYASYDHIEVVTIPKTGTFLLQKTISLMHKYCEDKSLIRPVCGSHLRSGKKVKVLSILRDPRDRLISFAYERRDKKKDAGLQDMSIQEILTGLIEDYGLFVGTYIAPGSDWSEFHTLLDLHRSYDEYLAHCDVYVTQFEKLVGHRGQEKSDNAKELQIQEIMNIAQHIEIPISYEIASKISNELFGGTYTFREGKAGSWKKEFTYEHKEMIKRDIGQLLITYGYENDLDW